MPNCAVYGCNNHNRKTKGTFIKYYKFPKDEFFCSKWIASCKRDDKINISNATICSEHFEEDYFERPLHDAFVKYNPKIRNLKSDAVPTKKLPSSKPETKSNINRENRSRKRKYKTIVGELLSQERIGVQTQSRSDDVSLSVSDHGMECNTDSVTSPLEPLNPLEKIKELEEKLKIMETENYKLKNNLNILTEKCNVLETEKKSILEDLTKIKYVSDNFEVKVQNILLKVFSPGQVKTLLNPNKRIKWSSEDIACAISLRSVSAKAYRYLRNKLKYPLPALSTLRRWVSKLVCSPGILNQVLLIMKNNGKALNDFEKLTCLSFDEMSLSKRLCFERKDEHVFGPHSHAQVVMARGLTGKWKQPIFFDFDTPMTTEILFKVICSLEEVGYKIISVTCDLGGENRAMWVKLGITENQNSFCNPFDPSRQIFVFGDVPHLLKLARNHFLSKGFVHNGKTILTADCLKEIVNLQKLDLKIAFKIGEEHLFVKNKQNVKLAAQLFSNTTASAVMYLGENNIINSANWKDISEMIKLFNDWFDVFNSNVPYDKIDEKCGYGLKIEKQTEILQNMSNYIKDVLVKGKKSMLPFQKGILISNKSLKDLFSYLNKTFNITYILTNKLNQDVLENLFSYIRSMGKTYDHPDALQFMYRMRWYIMGKHSSTVFSVKSNIKPDDEVCLSSPSSINVPEEQCPTAVIISNLMQGIDDENVDDDNFFSDLDCLETQAFQQDANPEDKIKYEGLKYISGYVAFKLKKKFPQLGVRTCSLGTEINQSWTETVSEGGLCVPSDEYMEAAKMIESAFIEINGNNDLCRGKWAVQNIYRLVKNNLLCQNIPEEAIKRLILTRIYIRLKHINKTMEERAKEANLQKKKKIQKFVK